MAILSYLVGIVSLGCLIYVLIKMYPKEGVVKTIFGFICALYAFVWGWQHIKTEEDPNFKKVIYVWTGAFALNIILYILSIVINQVFNNVQGALGG
jgi:hypothetical protein